MSENALQTYLNDHLAGSVSGLRLVEYCLRHNHRDNALKGFLQKFRQELREEQTILKQIIAQLDSSESIVKKMGAWFFEKMTHLKFRHSFQEDSPFSRFLELESLLIAVNGKTNLWRVLNTIFTDDLHFQRFNFKVLFQQSQRQIEEIEVHCLKAAHQAFLKSH